MDNLAASVVKRVQEGVEGKDKTQEEHAQQDKYDARVSPLIEQSHQQSQSKPEDDAGSHIIFGHSLSFEFVLVLSEFLAISDKLRDGHSES